MRLWLVLLLAACNGGADTNETAGDADTDSDTDTDTDTDADSDTDTDLCADGAPIRAFDTSASSSELRGLAGDFTLETDGGPFTLSEQWTGCDTYLFVPSQPRQARDWPEALWSRDVDDLVDNLPDNVHVFFWSSEYDEEDIAAETTVLSDGIAEALADLEEDERAHWESRLHILDGTYQTDESWVADVLNNPEWGFGIDRFQRVRYQGSLADVDRYSSTAGWFAPNLGQAAYDPQYWNFEALRQVRLDAENATVVHAWDGDVIEDPGWAGQRGYADIDLDPEMLAAADTLEIDITKNCVGDGEYGDCPAWDYLAYLYLCDEDDPDTCNTRIGRFITTYHREGRWTVDASFALPLLGDGGPRRLAYWTVQPYEVTMDLRFFDAGKPTRPTETTYLWGGGGFDVNYNTNHAPVEVAIPADATMSELHVVISGHGGAQPGNCAEFCVTEHHFYVNGVEHRIDLEDAGTERGCENDVGNGTVPNQYGTWWYGRSNWCPGKEVAPIVVDVTDDVVPGETATFTYEAFYKGDPYPSGGANIDLDAWLVAGK